MTEPAAAAVPVPDAPVPAGPSAGPHEGILRHIESWFEDHAKPDLDDLRGAVQELEAVKGLHARNAQGVAAVAQKILAVLKEVAPNATVLPELETAVEDVVRVAGELATVL